MADDRMADGSAPPPNPGPAPAPLDAESLARYIASQVAQQLTPLATTVAELTTRVSSLQLGPAPPQGPLPPPPEQISSAALHNLLLLPTLPADYYPLLLPLAIAFDKVGSSLTPSELEAFQAAYTQARAAALTPLPSPRIPAFSRGRGRGRAADFQYYNQLYHRTAAGRTYNMSTEAPPFGCFNCGAPDHWIAQCPYPKNSRGAAPAPLPVPPGGAAF